MRILYPPGLVIPLLILTLCVPAMAFAGGPPTRTNLPAHDLPVDFETLQASGYEGPLAVPGDEFWQETFRGTMVDYEVRTLAMYQGDLIAGGYFRSAGGVPGTEGIARWDGTGWHAMGLGDNAIVFALTVYDGELYAGGRFLRLEGAPSSGILRWDGEAWHPVGSGMDNQVLALLVHDGALYAGGSFTTAGTAEANRIARWDGSTWSAVGAGFDGSVLALASHQNSLVAAGGFLSSGETELNHVGVWDGSSWSALGTGTNDEVSAVASFDSSLVVGGRFMAAGGVPGTKYIAAWNGSEWESIALGTNGAVRALLASEDRLIVGGDFTIIGLSTAGGVATWDGDTWARLGVGFMYDIPCCPGRVSALLEAGDCIYAGGLFTSAGAEETINIAVWDGAAWTSPMGSTVGSLSGSVNCLTSFQGQLVAGGIFTHAGGRAVNRIARWDGITWKPFGNGMNGNVMALAVHEGELYAAGFFTTAGDVPVNRIAKWNGSAWEPLGAGVTGDVMALLSLGDDLYAGGWFTAAGGQASNVARWDGETWHALGKGVRGRMEHGVRALCEYNGDVIIGGDFTIAGDITVNGIARWDGSTWSPLGTGLVGIDNDGQAYLPRAHALAVHEGDLIAGGDFTSAGGVPARFIARWDGASWSPLGNGTGSAVNALAIYGTELFAAGVVLPPARIARWDGSSWNPLGSGTNIFIMCLAVHDGSLFVGGPFTTAGEKPALYLARWNDGRTPVSLLHFNVQRVGAAAIVRWEVADPVDHLRFHVYRQEPGQDRQRLTETLLADRTSYEFRDENPPQGPASYWLAEISRTGSQTWYGPVDLAAAEAPRGLVLYQNLPNPFRSNTRLVFDTSRPGPVTVSIHDVMGREIARPVERNLTEGRHEIGWDGRDELGRRLPAGVYLMRVETPEGVQARRMVKLE